ncbi:hypothetical protein ASE63_07100 [Bosea sp. Root381]|jgi:rhodanese-related sulfurtransferase|uniref:rhodanese-like domain-containing protein n=1 Tax=Bosea sp. Root381 TaxID=1736524 RepID=UPI0006FE681A|nr:rhodanese-like domain-containing protein [Bosea sp. Root381]KRE02135.1 hypothetical protein ASE63_07100 [Bosea sp. Root381]
MRKGATTRRTILAGSLALPASFVFGQGAASLSPRDAHEAVRAGRLIVVDIRTPEEWRDTGLPQGALPLDADGAAFEPRLAGLRLDHPKRPIAFIDRTGAQAAALAAKLTGRGWRDVRAVRGGMLAPGGWLAEKLPVTDYR